MMPIDYSKLKPGDSISKKTYVLDAATVARYIDAVADRSRRGIGDEGRDAVPPMAVAAMSLRGVVNDLQIPGGTLHVGQELEFCEAVSEGDTLDCMATLVQNSVRGDWRYLVVRLAAVNSKGREVMGGKSTIVLPT